MHLQLAHGLEYCWVNLEIKMIREELHIGSVITLVEVS
jgi:hypothetical protein